jgi:hypothetical protein
MRIPGFTAETTLARSRSGGLHFRLNNAGNRLYPAMLIELDGVPICEGEIIDGGIQCYGDSGGGVDGGGGRGGGGGAGGGPTCVARCGPCKHNRRGVWQRACLGRDCKVTVSPCSPFGVVHTGPLSGFSQG